MTFAFAESGAFGLAHRRRSVSFTILRRTPSFCLTLQRRGSPEAMGSVDAAVQFKLRRYLRSRSVARALAPVDARDGVRDQRRGGVLAPGARPRHGVRGGGVAGQRSGRLGAMRLTDKFARPGGRHRSPALQARVSCSAERGPAPHRLGPWDRRTRGAPRRGSLGGSAISPRRRPPGTSGRLAVGLVLQPTWKAPGAPSPPRQEGAGGGRVCRRGQPLPRSGQRAAETGRRDEAARPRDRAVEAGV